MRDPDDLMIPFDEALRRADEACAGRRTESEVVPVRAAVGRVLRADCRSELALPPFDKSAVDGYAIAAEASDAGRAASDLVDPVPAGRGADPFRLVGRAFRVAGVVHAGDAPPPALVPGTAVLVMTGAPVPPGTDRVVMREHTEAVGDQVRVVRAQSARHICRRGEDMQPGGLVLAAGAFVRPLDLGTLVAAGLEEVRVARPVRLAILATGNEIVDRPEEIVPGRIMNSNGPMLAALARAPWLECVEERRVPDTLAATRAAIARASDAADLVLLSGGVSEGDSDHVAPALGSLGARLLFTRVAVKPGKPVTLAAHADALVLGLPGNPVSAYLMFHLFARRIAARLAGAEPEARLLRLPLAAPFRRSKAARLEFVPGLLTGEGRVEPIRYHGSAHLNALSRADGFFRVPPGATDLPGGSEVDFEPMGGRLGS